MEISDIIQLISAMASSVLSIVAILVSVLTLIQNSKMIKESARANIVFYIEHSRYGQDCHLVIKNFGSSVGRLLKINITPKLDYKKCHTFTNGPKVITECENILLAPQQKISSFFDLINYEDQKLHIKIEYETLGKRYEDEYDIDLTYSHSVATKKQESKDEIKSLNHINDSLQQINEKL